MPDPSKAGLTERQEKWFASLRAGLERETGHTLAEWAERARACPETAPRARLAWMKTQHGLAQNRASMVLQAAFPSKLSWSTPDLVAETLWADPHLAEIMAALRKRVEALGEVVVGQRKTFTGFSRRVQFAAARPVKDAVMLGLALPPAFDGRLEASGREGWSERLQSRVRLRRTDDVDAPLAGLLHDAWQRS